MTANVSYLLLCELLVEYSSVNLRSKNNISKFLGGVSYLYLSKKISASSANNSNVICKMQTLIPIMQ